MKLKVKEENKVYERDVNNVDDLKDLLKDYGNMFLPEIDDLVYDVYNSGDYEELIGGLDYYIKGRELDTATKYYRLLDKVVKMNDFNGIINKLNEFNKILREGDINITFLNE